MIRIRRWVLYSVLCALFLITFYHLSPSTSTGPNSKQPRPQPTPTQYSATTHDHKWHGRPVKYPVASLVPLPTGRPRAIPKVQFSFEAENERNKRIRLDRLKIIHEAFTHSWEGYKSQAWLKDEVAPITGGHRTTFGGWGATLVDTLDTLWIMGKKEDFEEAVQAVSKIDFSTVEQVPLNIFETTIRYLGGLLGAYDVSEGKYPVLLSKAIEVGEMLYAAFDTPNRMPISRWMPDEAAAQQGLEKTLLAEIGSLSLEFTRLSQLSGDMRYFDAIQRITDVLDLQQNRTKLPGMWPILVNARTGDFSRDTFFTLGGMADSAYEYLPKVRMRLIITL
jgi:mannosyl-oligosaccharide alpha-1,2-mannosidase